MDPGEEMLRRVNTIITSIPAGVQPSFYKQPGSKEEQLEGGADGSITLPITLNQLRNIVQEEVRVDQDPIVCIYAARGFWY